MVRTITAFVVSVFLTLVGCSSESEPGEQCEQPGGTVDVCEEGTVCGKPSDKAYAFVCIPICFEDAQCPKDYDCKGVEGTNIKGCRAKD